MSDCEDQSRIIPTDKSQDIVFSTTQKIYQNAFSVNDDFNTASKPGIQFIDEKRKELYDMLDHLDEALVGKSHLEAMAVFSSFLTLQSQLCMQKTDGFTLVRIHFSDLFPSLASRGNYPNLHQMVVFIFLPAEINTIRNRLSEMKEEDTLKFFFTKILDQSFDMTQFNEMTGRLLLEMSNYFILQLENSEYGETLQSLKFRERYEKSKLIFERSVQELREIETIIHRHIEVHPVLEELPRLLHDLLLTRLGMPTSLKKRQIISRITAVMNDYIRARIAVTFDFNRLPTFQHSIHLRHTNILHLQKELLGYSGEILKQDILKVEGELKRLLMEIETGSESLKTGDPEYEIKIKIKANLLERLEQYRRKVNLIKSHENMVKVQQDLVQETIKRYQKQIGYDQDLEEKLRHQIKSNKVKLHKSSVSPETNGVNHSSSLQIKTRK